MSHARPVVAEEAKEKLKEVIALRHADVQWYGCPDCGSNQHYSSIWSFTELSKVRNCEKCGCVFHSVKNELAYSELLVRGRQLPVVPHPRA